MNGFYIAPPFMDSLWFTSPRTLWTCLTSRWQSHKSPSFMLLVFFIPVVKWTLEPSVESQITFAHISTMVFRPWMSARYLKYEKRCLNERKRLGIGCIKEMNTLYHFWSHYLRSRFNQWMYDVFQKAALEDADASYNYGIECLFRFYSYGLETQFRADLYGDFERLALQFYHKGNLYGLEKYWAFHHYRHKSEPLKKNGELEKLLTGEYRSTSVPDKHDDK